MQSQTSTTSQALENQLQEVKTEFTAVQSRLSSSEQTLSSVTLERDMLREQVNSYAGRTDNDQGRVVKLKETVTQLGAEVATLSASLAELKRKHEKACRAQRSAEEARDDLKEKVLELQRQGRRMESKLAEYEEVNAELLGRHSELKVKESNTNVRLTVLEETNDEMSDTITRLEAELVAARACAAEAENSQPTVTTTACPPAQLAEDLDGLQQLLQSVSADRDRMAAELVEVKDALAGTKADYRKAQLEATQTASLDGVAYLQTRLLAEKENSKELREQLAQLHEAMKTAEDAHKRHFDEEQGNNLDLIMEVEGLRKSLDSAQAAHGTVLVSSGSRKKKSRIRGGNDRKMVCTSFCVCMCWGGRALPALCDRQ